MFERVTPKQIDDLKRVDAVRSAKMNTSTVGPSYMVHDGEAYLLTRSNRGQEAEVARRQN